MNEITVKEFMKRAGESVSEGFIQGILGAENENLEKSKQKLIYEKSLYLQDVKNKIEVLEQKIDDGIITRKEIIDLHGLYKIKKKTDEDIDKLYSIDWGSDDGSKD